MDFQLNQNSPPELRRQTFVFSKSQSNTPVGRMKKARRFGFGKMVCRRFGALLGLAYSAEALWFFTP
jgi:hypothetical protein